eukprot:TRINITY_DN2257_c0_g1_i1.p1 TRINITY_DN2257_c0_g1~~TRINITY_DN2257_c0_g1_i1.p1  ORF type:complete len:824 (-),score=131.58 TRINITY_DN2257_c0_g1_i1:389-2860(-)
MSHKSLDDFLNDDSDDDGDRGRIPRSSDSGSVGGISARMPAGNHRSFPSPPGGSRGPSPGPGRQLEKPESISSLGPVGTLHGRSKSPASLEKRGDFTAGLGPVGSLRGRSQSPASLENPRESRGQKMDKRGVGLGLGPTDTLLNRSKSPTPPGDPFASKGMASMGRGGSAGSAKHLERPDPFSNTSHGRSKSPAQLEHPRGGRSFEPTPPEMGLGLGPMDKQRSRSKSPAPFDDPLASQGLVMLGSPGSQGEQHLGRPDSLTSLGPVGSLHDRSKSEKSRASSRERKRSQEVPDSMTSLGPVGSLRGRSKSPTPPEAGLGLGPVEGLSSRTHSRAPSEDPIRPSLSQGGPPAPGHRFGKPDPMASLGPVGSLRGRLNVPPSLESPTHMAGNDLGSLRGVRSRSGSPRPPADRAEDQDRLSPSPSFSRGLSSRQNEGFTASNAAAARCDGGVTWQSEFHSAPERLGAPSEDSPTGASVSSRSKKHKKDKKDKKHKKHVQDDGDDEGQDLLWGGASQQSDGGASVSSRSKKQKKDKKEKKHKKHAHDDRDDEGHDLLWSQHGNHLALEGPQNLDLGGLDHDKDKSKKHKKDKKDKNDKHNIHAGNAMEDEVAFSQQFIDSAAQQKHTEKAGQALVCRFLVTFEPLSMSVCWKEGNTRRVSAPREIKPSELGNEQSLQYIAHELQNLWQLPHKHQSQLVALVHRLCARRLPVYRVIDAGNSMLAERPGGEALQDIRLPQGALFLAVDRVCEGAWWWLRLASGRCWMRHCVAEPGRAGEVAELFEPSLDEVRRCRDQMRDHSLSSGCLAIAEPNIRLVEKQMRRSST